MQNQRIGRAIAAIGPEHRPIIARFLAELIDKERGRSPATSRPARDREGRNQGGETESLACERPSSRMKRRISSSSMMMTDPHVLYRFLSENGYRVSTADNAR